MIGVWLLLFFCETELWVVYKGIISGLFIQLRQHNAGMLEDNHTNAQLIATLAYEYHWYGLFNCL